MSGSTVTKIFILADAALVVGYDIFAYRRWGVGATISRVVIRWAEASTVGAVAIGFVIGGLLVHLFWRQRPGADE